LSTAIYPGTFDPITLGHLNVIRRAAAIFDKVIVCVMVNAGKNPMFSLDERKELIKKVVYRFKNVGVDSSDGLLAEYCARYEKPVIIKGLRAVSDFDSEFQMALINRKINPELDTLFLTAGEKYMFLSSSAVKEIAKYGANLSEFVPFEIIDDVLSRAGNAPRKT